MSAFCKLSDPSTYVACEWDLSLDPVGRSYWVEFFPRHLETILRIGIEAAVARGEDAVLDQEERHRSAARRQTAGQCVEVVGVTGRERVA